ncbi:MAG: ABC transporter ATP-binding protein [Gammaproteobacteria bacterium]
MTELNATALTVTAGGHTLLRDADLSLKPREFVVVLGANGAGKTSLVRAALGLLDVDSGISQIGGDDVQRLTSMQRARRVAYLPQVRPLAWPSTVRDVVALGRFSHGAAMGRLKPADAAAVDDALTACDLVALAARRTDTLSGGELARVHSARAFAAQAPLLIADEPMASLDPRHQFRMMDLMQSFVKRGGGVLVVAHDIAIAARYATRLVWMKAGRVVADGAPTQTLTEARVEDVYGIAARIDGREVMVKGLAPS